MIKNTKLLLGAMMVIPFLSIPLIGKKSFKRFMPAGIFISLVVGAVSVMARKWKWWWWYEKLHTRIPGITPFIGPFFIGSIWILKFTYGKFTRFVLINLIVDSLFTYVFVNYLTKSGIASLVRMKKIHLSLIFFIEALLLYGFQYVKEKVVSY